MLTQSGSSINENLESTDDGFDVEALINGRSKLFIDGKFYHAYLDQELINILEIEETSLEKPVTELFIQMKYLLHLQKVCLLVYLSIFL